jgi:hypothetical protein
MIVPDRPGSMNATDGGEGQAMIDKDKPAVPLTNRHDLPATPLRLADVPAGEEVRFGRLVWHRIPNGRPLVSVAIRCKICRSDHWQPWRWDWGLDADVVSFQTARCFRGPKTPYWVGLDTSVADENAKVHAEAHEAYVAWVAMRAEARSAGDKAAEAGG